MENIDIKNLVRFNCLDIDGWMCVDRKDIVSIKYMWYTKDDGRFGIIFIDKGEKIGYRVDLNTISRATGYWDSNNELIFEYDIVKLPDGKEYTVIYDEANDLGFLLHSFDRPMLLKDYNDISVITGNKFGKKF